MRGVSIRDGTEPGISGGLALDLAEILSALGERVAGSRWRGRGLSYVAREERDIETLERLSAGAEVAGAEFLAALPYLLQVIDGELEGLDAEEGLPWVVVRVVDNSWWEVRYDEPAVLIAVRARFRVVGDLPDDTQTSS